MSDVTPMELFVELSAILTGIDKDTLAPPLSPINIKQSYFDTAQSKASDAFAELLDGYARIRVPNPTPEQQQQIGQTILEQSGPAVGNLARTIMLMWYLGSWYAPTDPQLYEDPTKAPLPVVISANAYTQGWSWRVAQAHPMGFSQLQFGYWTETPPPLEDFTGTGG